MQELDFALRGDYITLDKLLKACGLAESGGRAKTLVSEGQIRVDGQLETRKTCKIRTGQVVQSGDTLVRVCATPGLQEIAPGSL